MFAARRRHARRGGKLRELIRSIQIGSSTQSGAISSSAAQIFLAAVSPQIPCSSAFRCQSAFKLDPSLASNFDPFVRRGLLVALGSSELAGVAETRRARVAWLSSRLLNR
jgi:hypothetical protein